MKGDFTFCNMFPWLDGSTPAWLASVGIVVVIGLLAALFFRRKKVQVQNEDGRGTHAVDVVAWGSVVIGVILLALGWLYGTSAMSCTFADRPIEPMMLGGGFMIGFGFLIGLVAKNLKSGIKKAGAFGGGAVIALAFVLFALYFPKGGYPSFGSLRDNAIGFIFTAVVLVALGKVLLGGTKKKKTDHEREEEETARLVNAVLRSTRRPAH